MKTTFDLIQQLNTIAKKAKGSIKSLRNAVERNAVIACEAMEETAKAHTPHSGDGKRRGFNVISNSLQESWVAEYIPSGEKNQVGSISLTNNKPYAVFVQNGHKVSRHFVPWLYKDGGGMLSYETNHNQPMFGLIVGTKTPYVKGVDMVGPAVDAFNDKFDELTQKTLSKFEKK